MGWNAGGFGALTFPDAKAVAGWKASTGRYADFADWEAESEFEVEDARRGLQVVVKDDLAAWAKPSRDGDFVQVELDGTQLGFWMDMSEDGYREHVAEVALLLRAAAAHGARGTCWFLGTAGAEGDFVYALTLGRGRSTLAALDGKAADAVYRSPGYRALMGRCLSNYEAVSPRFKAQMDTERHGTAAAAAAPAERRWGAVQARLALAPAKALLKALAGYPGQLPTGRNDRQAPAQLYATEAALRAALQAGASEEVRGLGLWLVAQVDREVGTAPALETLADPKASEPLRVAALWALAGDRSDAALDALFDELQAPRGLMTLYAAAQSVRACTHPQLGDRIQDFLKAAGKVKRRLTQPEQTAIFTVLFVAKSRRFTALLQAVVDFARSKADPATRLKAAELVVEWDDDVGLGRLEGSYAEDSLVGRLACAVMLKRSPDLALHWATRRLKAKRRDQKADAPLLHFLEALDADVQAAKKQRRVPVVKADPRWKQVVLDAVKLGESYLAFHGIGLLPALKGDRAVVTALQAWLARPKASPVAICQTLDALLEPALLPQLRASLAHPTTDFEKDYLTQLIRKLEKRASPATSSRASSRPSAARSAPSGSATGSRSRPKKTR
jgi:hypothetical protein